MNMHSVHKQIAVKVHLYPLEVTSKYPMVSIANTAMGICSSCNVSVDTCHVG